MSATTARQESNRTLLAALVATVAMLFTAFAAAYLERRGATKAWTTISVPGVVWLNTALLALSSVTLELARRSGRRGPLAATIVLGVLFLGGQLLAWRTLRAEGVFLPSSPHASFFYILTGVHGLHLVAGLIALALAATNRAVLGLCAGFWHFMGVVWLYVLFVLTVL